MCYGLRSRENKSPKNWQKYATGSDSGHATHTYTTRRGDSIHNYIMDCLWRQKVTLLGNGGTEH